MAAQLVVGAARTVGKKVVERSAPDLKGGVERSRTVRNLEARVNGYRGRKVDRRAMPQNQQSPLLQKNTPPTRKISIGSENNTLTKRVRVMNACIKNPLVMWVVGGLWALQFCVWGFGMVGLGIEKIPGANLLYPGVTLFEFSYFFIGIVGIITLIIIAGVFVASKVECFSGAKLLVFALTFCLYWLPFLGLFPWFGLWLIAVIYLQNED